MNAENNIDFFSGNPEKKERKEIMLKGKEAIDSVLKDAWNRIPQKI